eukprot:5008943-Prymnesium_polylepis.1
MIRYDLANRSSAQFIFTACVHIINAYRSHRARRVVPRSVRTFDRVCTHIDGGAMALALLCSCCAAACSACVCVLWRGGVFVVVACAVAAVAPRLASRVASAAVVAAVAAATVAVALFCCCHCHGCCSSEDLRPW